MSTSILTLAQYTTPTRRQYVRDPRFATLSNWGVPVGSTVSVASGVMDLTTGSASASNFIIPSQLSWYSSFLPGDVVSVAYVVQNLSAAALDFRIAVWTGAVYLYGAWTTIAAGATQRVVGEGLVAPAGLSYLQPRLHGVVPSGARVKVSEPLFEKAPALGTYFDGTTAPVAGYSYAWDGPANNAQSVESLTVPRIFTPELVDGFEASRTVGNIVHDIMDRSDPDVTLRAAGLRRGVFRCLFPRQSDALTAYAELSEPQLFQVVDPDLPAIGMTFVVGPEGSDIRLTLDDATRKLWWLEVPFVEVST